MPDCEANVYCLEHTGMVSSMKLITVVVILSRYFLLTEGQNGQPHETYQEFQKRCAGVIREQFVKEKFPNKFTQQYTNAIMAVGRMVLPSFSVSFTDKGQTGKLSLKDGLFEAGFISNNGFLEDRSKITYSFKVPVVNCTYSYRFEQSNVGSTFGHVNIRILDVLFSFLSSVQNNGRDCRISTPTITMFAKPNNYLVRFFQNPSNSSVASNVTEVVINSFVGTHMTPIQDTLRTVLIPLMVTAWPKTLKEAKANFEMPYKPQNPDGVLCYAITNLHTTSINKELIEQLCPGV